DCEQGELSSQQEGMNSNSSRYTAGAPHLVLHLPHEAVVQPTTDEQSIGKSRSTITFNSNRRLRSDEWQLQICLPRPSRQELTFIPKSEQGSEPWQIQERQQLTSMEIKLAPIEGILVQIQRQFSRPERGGRSS
ncbi:hypothetical protein ACLOJK_037233, partial [Asimina triloba]